MRWKAWMAGLIVLALAFALWVLRTPHVPDRNLTGLTGDAQRGAYMARAAGCIACHAEPESERGFLAGGAGIDTPFGTFYGPNITPSKTQGLGTWSLADFSRALTAGVSPSGERYYPVFPYTHYTRLTDQDIVDIWAALRTVPPSDARSQDHDVGFPFNQRFALRAWQNLFMRPGRFEPASDRDEAWNRGAYLVNAAGHCGACHTPRNILGVQKRDNALAGSSGGPGGEKVPAIRGGALRDKGWTQEDLVVALQLGLTPKGDVLGGSMAEVIDQGTSFLEKRDLEAIAAYLWSLE